MPYSYMHGYENIWYNMALQFDIRFYHAQWQNYLKRYLAHKCFSVMYWCFKICFVETRAYRPNFLYCEMQRHAHEWILNVLFSCCEHNERFFKQTLGNTATSCIKNMMMYTVICREGISFCLTYYNHDYAYYDL